MSEHADILARANRISVEAPAGCGKTYLIAESLAQCADRQLVLTHTNAGVYALRRRMRKLNVEPTKAVVATIDSWALGYARCFPTLSGFQAHWLEDQDWIKIRIAACQALKYRAVRSVLTRSYGGVIVDEYQDCGESQHALLSLVSDYLPCRVLGDRLQAIYHLRADSEPVPWNEITSQFPTRFNLDHPHRWDKARDLGEWLLGLRSDLMHGQSVDLSTGPRPFVTYQEADESEHVRACMNLHRANHRTVFVLRKWPQELSRLAGSLRNVFHVLERAGCPDLLSRVGALEDADEAERVSLLGVYIKSDIAGLSAVPIDRMVATALGDDTYAPSRRDYQEALGALHVVVSEGTLRSCARALRAVTKIGGTLRRSGLWRDLIRVLELHDEASEGACVSTAQAILEARRSAGARPPRRCLSNPDRIKGLQCDAALVLNPDQFQAAESLYVALTRASDRLHIVGRSLVVTLPRALPDALATR